MIKYRAHGVEGLNGTINTIDRVAWIEWDPDPERPTLPCRSIPWRIENDDEDAAKAAAEDMSSWGWEIEEIEEKDE